MKRKRIIQSISFWLMIVTFISALIHAFINDERYIDIKFTIVVLILLIINICISRDFKFSSTIKKENFKNDIHIKYSKDSSYYNNFLNKYSIFELSYVGNMEIELNKDVVATLLKLEKIGKITLGEEIIVNDSQIELKKSENYILDCLDKGKIKNINVKKLKNIVIKEAKKDNILGYRYKYSIKSWINTIIILLITSIVFLILNNIYKFYDIDFNITLIHFIVVLLLTFLTLFAMIGKDIVNEYSNSYVITGEGIDVKETIEYLSNIKNVNLISKEEQKIYRILLNKDKNRVDELSNKYLSI